jgi:hypothetical protein
MKSDIRNCLALAVLVLVAGRVAAEEPQQVQIQVVIAEVDKACLETLGLAYPTPQSSQLVMEPARCQDFLSTRRSLGLAKLLAQPRLITCVGQEACFQVAGNDSAPCAISLNVTPESCQGGRLRLKLAAEFATTKPGGTFQPVPGITLQQPTIDFRQVATTVEVCGGETAVLAMPGEPRASLVCITPELVRPPQTKPVDAVPGQPLLPDVRYVLPGTIPSPVVQYDRPAPAPAPLAGKTTDETWAFTANDNQLIVHAEGGQRLRAMHLVLPINAREFRFAAINEQVRFEGSEFGILADSVVYDRRGSKLTLRGHVHFISTTADHQLEARGAECVLDLATGNLTVTGAANLRTAPQK